jgi:hypothetical protein
VGLLCRRLIALSPKRGANLWKVAGFWSGRARYTFFCNAMPLRDSRGYVSHQRTKQNQFSTANGRSPSAALGCFV